MPKHQFRKLFIKFATFTIPTNKFCNYYFFFTFHFKVWLSWKSNYAFFCKKGILKTNDVCHSLISWLHKTKKIWFLEIHFNVSLFCNPGEKVLILFESTGQICPLAFMILKDILPWIGEQLHIEIYFQKNSRNADICVFLWKIVGT